MRVPRPAVLAAVAVVALGGSACGGAGDASAVERLIEEDWNAAEAGDARWPGHPDLDGTRAASVRCPGEVSRGSLRCTVRVEGGSRAHTELTVVADVDDGGAVRRWRLEG
jgi:hypothetical protein